MSAVFRSQYAPAALFGSQEMYDTPATIVSTTQAGGWSMRNRVATTQAGGWTFGGMASAIQAGSWSVRNTATATQAGSWSVWNTATATQAGSWSVRKLVAASQAGVWSIGASLPGAELTTDEMRDLYNRVIAMQTEIAALKVTVGLIPALL